MTFPNKIQLSETVFEFKDVVHDLKTETFLLKDKLKVLADFGTVLVFDPAILPLSKELEGSVFATSVEEGSPLFEAPVEWRMPQLMRSLGAFKSASAASKNGWNFDIPEGFSQHSVRINKVKGCLTIHKVTADSGWFA